MGMWDRRRTRKRAEAVRRRMDEMPLPARSGPVLWGPSTAPQGAPGPRPRNAPADPMSAPGTDPDRAPDPILPPRPVHDPDLVTRRDRQPLVPYGLRAPRETLREGVHRAGFVAGFHLMRSPLYLLQNLLWAPRGVQRAISGAVRWVQDHEDRDVEWSSKWAAITATYDYASYVRVTMLRARRVRSRTALAILGSALLLVGAGIGLVIPWTAPGTVLALILGFGWLGRPLDRPYIPSAVVTSEKGRRVTPNQILVALKAAGLAKETMGEGAPVFGPQGVYKDGPGYGAVINLPAPKTAQDAIEARDKIAAGLQISQFQLFLSQEHGPRGHAGQVRMWIAEEDPHTREPQVSPLVKAKRFDLWDSVPFGVNERGDRVGFPLVWTSVLIGALPRMGKTSTLRLLLSAAALDPHVRMMAWDGKGGKDLAALEQVAHAFGAGQDDAVTRALLDSLTRLEQDMAARYQHMRKLPDEECPEGKLTPALAQDPKAGMPLTVVAIDEFQVFLENKRHGARILESLTNLAKVGPAAGIILVLSTQRPSSSVMKTDFRDVIGTRFALRVTTREFSEMILGSGSYRAGLDASKFLASHKGVGILLGADDGPLADKGGQVLHTHMLDLRQFAAICQRGRSLREDAGTLSGVAAGEEEEALSDRILEHVASVFQAGEDKAHSETLCARLAGKYPGLYEGFDPQDLAAALGRHGIPTSKQVWAPRLKDNEPANQRGFHRKDIIDRIAERADPVPDTPPDDL